MKIRKWIVLLIAVVVTGTLILRFGGWMLLRRTPDWYARDTSTPEQRRAAANKAQNKLIAFYDWMAASRAASEQTAQSGGGTTRQVADVINRGPARPCEITFTDEELNAFFNKWADTLGRRAMFEKYIDDPRLVFRNQQLILVGKVKELGIIVSIEFEPVIDSDGNLRMNLVHVLGGMLPLPDSMWAGQRRKVEQTLKEKLGPLQRRANIAADGVANGQAGAVAMNKLVWSALHDRPSDSIVFIPFDVADLGRSLPVKVTAVDIKDHSITLTAEQLTPRARAGLLDHLRRPYTDPNATEANTAQVSAAR